ncbi:MAG: IPExxxVDY family protein [Bacteroidales bacterium]
MPKKITLHIHSESDYFLIGISSHLKDYRLSFFLNQYLGYNFRRIEDLPGGRSVSNSDGHSVYAYENPETRSHFCLIANNHPEGKLIPELRHTDFLLLTRDILENERYKSIVEKIRKIPQVLLAFTIDPSMLKDIDPVLNEIELHMHKHGHGGSG